MPPLAHGAWRERLAPCGASALLHLGASPPFEYWPCALIAAAPAYLLVRDLTPGRAGAWGWALGMLTGLVGLYWLPKPLMLHGGVPWVGAFLLTVLYCAYQALRWAALGWRASERDAGVHRGLAFCTAYPVSELVLPLLLPWHLGELVPSASWVAQCADLGGPLLVSLLIASSGVAAARLKDGWRCAWREWLGHVVLWACALGYGADSPSHSFRRQLRHRTWWFGVKPWPACAWPAAAKISRWRASSPVASRRH